MSVRVCARLAYVHSRHCCVDIAEQINASTGDRRNAVCYWAPDYLEATEPFHQAQTGNGRSRRGQHSTAYLESAVQPSGRRRAPRRA